MRNDPETAVIQTVETLFRLGTTSNLTDADLLDRFVSSEPEFASAAFEVIVNRHGPMVFDICRKVLRDLHEAEDVFQATFLILARQARSIRKRGSVASWLFGVASRVAARARSDAAKRRFLERQLAENTAAREGRDEDHSAHALLHEAIASLPEKYRGPIVLCDLEGLTYQAAAERLGCPVGTVSVRLMRARARIRDRLLRQGELTRGELSSRPPADRESQRISQAMIAVTAQQALGFSSRVGPSLTSVPIPIAKLAEGVIHIMFFKQLIAFAAAALVSCLVLAGVGITGYRVLASAAQQVPPGGQPPGDSDRPSVEEATAKSLSPADQPKEAAAGEPPDQRGDPVRKGAIAQIQVARDAIRVLEQMKDRGEAVSEHEYGEWSLRLMQAKRDFAGTKAAEIEALEAHAARMKASAERASKLVRADAANLLPYYEARYRYNEATTWLEKARAEAAQQGSR